MATELLKRYDKGDVYGVYEEIYEETHCIKCGVRLQNSKYYEFGVCSPLCITLLDEEADE